MIPNTCVTILLTARPSNKSWQRDLTANPTHHPSRCMAYVVDVPDAHAMAALHRWISGNTCALLVLGYPKIARPEHVTTVANLPGGAPLLCVSKKARRDTQSGANGVFCRSLDDLLPSVWELVDIDGADGLHDNVAAMTFEERITLFEILMPEFIGAERVTTHSNSARLITETGELVFPAKRGNGHAYYRLDAPPESKPRWRLAMLHHHLERLTFGAFLTDRATWGGYERIDFCGSPIAPGGYRIAPQTIQVREGHPVNTKRVMASMPSEAAIVRAHGGTAPVMFRNGDAAASRNDLSADMVLRIVATGENVTVAELIATWDQRLKDGSMNRVQGIRCNTPWRESNSNTGGVFILFNDKHDMRHAMVYDTLGVEVYLAEADRQAAFPDYHRGQHRVMSILEKWRADRGL